MIGRRPAIESHGAPLGTTVPRFVYPTRVCDLWMRVSDPQAPDGGTATAKQSRHPISGA